MAILVASTADFEVLGCKPSYYARYSQVQLNFIRKVDGEALALRNENRIHQRKASKAPENILRLRSYRRYIGRRVGGAGCI